MSRKCAECEKPTEGGTFLCRKCQRKRNLKQFEDTLPYYFEHPTTLLNMCQQYEVWRYDDPSYHISEKAAVFITRLRKYLGWVPTRYHCQWGTLELHFGYLCDTPTMSRESLSLTSF